MKKIGILTIHSVYNYGAMLQAYALTEYLSSNGYEAKVLDYRPYIICRNYSFYLKDIFINPKRAVGVLRQNIFYSSKFKRFKEFLRKDIKKTNKIYYCDNDFENHGCDLIMTGSDQIWNPYITGGDSNFLLSFDMSVDKVAYSSSFGVSEIPSDWQVKVKKFLKDFQFIAVRENSGKKVLNSLLPEKKIYSVLDPVFLISRDNWLKQASDVLTPKNKYLLVYTLELNDEIVRIAKDVAKDKGLMIVCLHPFKDDYYFSDFCISNAGPKEFLSLINNADFVVTNSFHGTAFSIIFEKEFSCVLHSKTGTRMLNLFENFSMSKFDLNTKCDNIVPYYKVNQESRTIISQKIDESKFFLSKI